MVEADRGTVMEWVCESCIKPEVLSSSLSPRNTFPAALLTTPPPNPRSPPYASGTVTKTVFLLARIDTDLRTD
jgi:hypothetical protein